MTEAGMPEERAVIELEMVTVTYQHHVALEDITMRVSAGEFLAIVGPNGAGKTTLLKVVLGAVRPVSGIVHVFGKAPWELGGERRRIGYVPQGTEVDVSFPVRVYEMDGYVQFADQVPYWTAERYANLNTDYLDQHGIHVHVTDIRLDEMRDTVTVRVAADLDALFPAFGFPLDRTIEREGEAQVRMRAWRP